MTMTREQVAGLLDGIAHGDDTLQASMMTARGINAIEAAAPDLARQLLAAMDRLADADMAQAALVERAAEVVKPPQREPDDDVPDHWRFADDLLETRWLAIRALAPDAGVKDLAALRAERDSFRAVLEGAEYGSIESIAKNDAETSRALGKVVKQLTFNCYADRDRIAAELAEARKQVDALRGAAKDLRDALSDLLAAYSKPDDRLCCGGQDCGCQGATIYQQAEYYANSALAAYATALAAAEDGK